MNREMKNMWKKCLAAFLAAAAISIGIAGTALADETDAPRFVEGTVINNVTVGGLTADEARNQIENYYRGSYSLRIKDPEGKEYVIRDSEIGFSLKVTGVLETILEGQQNANLEGGPGAGSSYRIETESSYDRELLKQVLAALPLVTNATPTTDAHISAYEAGKPYTIIPEVEGTEIDMNKFVPVVEAALNEQRSVLRIEDTDSYKTINVRADDPALVELLDRMNRFGQMEITYVFGDQSYTLTGEAISQMVTGVENGEAVVDRNVAAAFVGVIANIYDTYGKPHTFHTTAGKDITLTSRNAYGWRIDQAAETDALIGMIRTGQTQSREPAYLNTANSRTGNDYGNTYVEVDMANQHLYLYENGTCIIDTPVVTGNISAGNGTPAGIYYVYSKERNRVLRGARRADGSYSYESPVSYWMPFNGGIGLHDANWRGSFGGSIYRTNGSHGCVNMPPKITPAVWEHVYVGMPVICHYNE